MIVLAADEVKIVKVACQGGVLKERRSVDAGGVEQVKVGRFLVEQSNEIFKRPSSHKGRHAAEHEAGRASMNKAE